MTRTDLQKDENNYSLWSRPMTGYEHFLSVLPDEWVNYYDVRKVVMAEIRARGLTDNDGSIKTWYQRALDGGVTEERPAVSPYGYKPYQNHRRVEVRCIPMPDRPVVDPAVVRAERKIGAPA